MKKIVITILAVILVLVLGITLLGEWWVESTISNILNKNPDRAYDITYQDLDLQAFFRGVTLDEAEITPINVSDSSTSVHGTVAHIELNGLRWEEFLLRKQINIRELIFLEPKFEVTVVKRAAQEEKESSKPLQGLFGDILTRGQIHSFRLKQASVEARSAADSMLMSKVINLSIEADDIETDSVQITNLIPFQTSRFHISVDSAYYQLNDYTKLTTGRIAYGSGNSEFELNDISLSFTEDYLTVSDRVGEQVDLIEADISQLKISGLDATSNIYSDLNIQAEKITIDGLKLKDFRDKNKPRPADMEKPMFSGMVSKVPIPLKVDSILILNSDVYYTELGEGMDEPGTVHFSIINAWVANVTSIPEYQEKYGEFQARISASINQNASMQVALDVPYQQDVFNLNAVISSLDLSTLNQTVTPLAGIEVKSGLAHNIDLKMNATSSQSSNVLQIDYDSLSLSVVKDQEHQHHTKSLISFIANSAIRRHNMPDKGRYVVAEFESFRNIHRGPFNFMWESVKEGMLYIIPTNASGILLGNPEKKAEKSLDKQEEKNNHSKRKKKANA